MKVIRNVGRAARQQFAKLYRRDTCVGSSPTRSAPTRNSEVLESFVRYCEANPEQRFWQALRNWSGAIRIYYVDEGGPVENTFNWEGRSS